MNTKKNIQTRVGIYFSATSLRSNQMCVGLLLHLIHGTPLNQAGTRKDVLFRALFRMQGFLFSNCPKQNPFKKLELLTIQYTNHPSVQQCNYLINIPSMVLHLLSTSLSILAFCPSVFLSILPSFLAYYPSTY